MVVFGASGSFELIAQRESRRRLRLHGELLKFEDRDLLRLAVFEHGEVVLLQALDGLAGFVLHRDVDDHQVAVGGERGDRALRCRLGGCWRGCAERRSERARQKRDVPLGSHASEVEPQ